MSKPSLADLQKLRAELCSPELDQGHLFVEWQNTSKAYTQSQINLLTELYNFQFSYPGGVQQYIRNGRELLAQESEEIAFTALEMPPLLYQAPSLCRESPELAELEAKGTSMLQRTVFVLVAGGLGERLGSSDIKVGLPVETATDTTYLDYYFSWAVQVGGSDVPFVIMTSDDTHHSTLRLIRLLNPHMPNLRVLKQEQVFCFSDSAAHIALDQYGKLLRKPHGHGDVHHLISSAKVTDGIVPSSPVPAASYTGKWSVANTYRSSSPSETAAYTGALTSLVEPEETLVDAWLKAGYQSIAFLQDTNAGATLTVPVSLAISAKNNLDMNFTCIPRLPKEAIGLLCRVKKDDDDPWMIANVEYNVFAEVARKLISERGDTAAKNSPYSPFPGSINTIVYKLSSYASVLFASRGSVPEFINPKYTDATRRIFKKPARIESLMQDMALLFGESEYRVGAAVFERFSYQPVKNSMDGAKALVEQGTAPYCAATGEADFYELQRRRVKAAGVPLCYTAQPEVTVADGTIPIHIFPIVVLDALCSGTGTLEALRGVFPSPENVVIDPKSTLLVEGRVIIESLDLRGALKIKGPLDPEAPPFVVKNVTVRNAGWKVHVLPPVDPDGAEHICEVDRIRDFVIDKDVLSVLDYKTDVVCSEDLSSGSDTAKL